MNLAPHSLLPTTYYPAHFPSPPSRPKRFNLLSGTVRRVATVRQRRIERKSPRQELRANVPRRYFTTEHSLVVSNERFLAWAESWNYFLDFDPKK